MPGYAASARRSAFTTSDRNPSEERSDLRASLVSLLTCVSSVGLRVFTTAVCVFLLLPYARQCAPLSGSCPQWSSNKTVKSKRCSRESLLEAQCSPAHLERESKKCCKVSEVRSPNHAGNSNDET